MDVSIPSVQLNVSPVAVSDMAVFETYELLRKIVIMPGSR